MVLIELGMFPSDKRESLARCVALSLDVVDASGLDYRCHTTGTVLEGRFDQVMDLVRQCFQAMAAYCNRIECGLRLDYRKGHQGHLDSKVRGMQHRLGRELRK